MEYISPREVDPVATMTEQVRRRIRRRLRLLCRERIRGNCYTVPTQLERYAHDRSIYRQLPVAVVAPADEAALGALVRFARDEDVVLIARGGGSGTAGAALGAGIIVDFRYFNHCDAPRQLSQPSGGRQSTDARGRCHSLVSVGSGVRHDRLQAHLAHHRLFLPVDPSSAGLSCIGGNVATKASGPHALRYGAIDRWLADLRFVDAEGRIIDSAAHADDANALPDPIRSGLRILRSRLLNDHQSITQLRRKAGRKTASGYNLFALVDDALVGNPQTDNPQTGNPQTGNRTVTNGESADKVASAQSTDRIDRVVPPLFCGSVGTLGLVSEVVLGCITPPTEQATLLLPCRDDAHACATASALRQGRSVDGSVDAVDAVDAIEYLDATCLQIARSHGAIPDDIADRLPADQPVLIVSISTDEVDGRAAIDAILADLEQTLTQVDLSVTGRLYRQDPQRRLWQMRAALLGLIGRHDGRRAYAIVNDIGIPPERLAEFLARVRPIFARLALPTPIYGHAGSGNLHLRPLFDPHAPDLQSQFDSVAEQVYDLVLEMDGTVTAEHGMGRLRNPYLEREWGTALYGYMRDLKRLFDPDDLLNPEALFPRLIQ